MDTTDWIAVVLMVVGALITLLAPPLFVVGVPMLLLGAFGLFASLLIGGTANILGLLGTGTARATNAATGKIGQTRILTGGDFESNKDHTSIPPGEFKSTQFEVATAAILHWDVDVLGDEHVDVIVTKEDEFERFVDEPNIKWSEKASRTGVNHENVRSRVGTGRWRLIIDNTGRSDTVEGESRVDVELTFDVKE
jgi:hypothetical protein